MKTLFYCAFLTVYFVGASAGASPQSLTYQGRVLKNDGTPLEYDKVQFDFKIMDPSGQYLIYEEMSGLIDMTGSRGAFDVPVGMGTRIFPDSSVQILDAAYVLNLGLLDVFNNSKKFYCKGSANPQCYVPATSEGRILRVQFWDGSGWRQISPDSVVRSVPFAGYAASAAKLGDFTATDFLTKAGLPSCSAGSFLTWNGSALTCNAAGGGSVTGLSGDVSGSGSGTVAATVNSIGGSSATDVHSAELLANAATSINTASALIKRDGTGSFAAGTGSFGSVVFRSGANTVTVSAPAGLSLNYSWRLPASQGGVNQVLTNDGSGNLAWSTPAAAGVSSVSVNSPVINTGTASAPMIGISQASGSQGGYLSSTDWSSFNSKMNNSLADAKIWIGDGTGKPAERSVAGDVTMTDMGMATVGKIQGTAVDSASPSGAGQVLRFDGTSKYTPKYLNLSDIRSSVTPTSSVFPSSSCASDQTLNWSVATDTFVCQTVTAGSGYPAQAQNLVLAGPTSGTAVPAFRALTVADLPNMDSTFMKVGGNAAMAAINMGTSTNYNLNIQTKALNAITIDTSQRVGIGTTTPSARLHVVGDVIFGSNPGFGSGNYILGTSNNLTGNTDANAVNILGFSNTVNSTLVGFSYNSTIVGMQNSFSNSAGNSTIVGVSNTVSAANSVTVGQYLTNTVMSSLMVGASNNARMTMLYAGGIGVQNNSPAYMFHVGSSAASGTVFAVQNSAGLCTFTPTSSATNFSCTSDERLKKDIAPIAGNEVLDRLLNLQAVTYRLKKGDGGELHTGYIAQNVERVSPEFVTRGKDGYLQVSYTGFIPWLSEGLKALYLDLREAKAQQKRDIASLQQENAELKKRLYKDEQELAAIKIKLGVK